VEVNGKGTREVILKGAPTLGGGLMVIPQFTGLHPGHKWVIVDPLVPVMLSPAHVVLKHLIPVGQQATRYRRMVTIY
jgi:hypothetical protein